MSRNPENRVRFIDLFAGLGGFHVALNELGAECVYACEIDPQLQDLYSRNFGLLPDGDIRKIRPEEVPDHDVLCAGFPCQPFSKAGSQRGLRDMDQGRLFFNVKAILKAKSPDFFILENVPNLVRHDHGKTFEKMKRHLKQLGYEVDVHRFSPHQFGIPQIRDRVYIVGALGGLQGFNWPEVENPPPTDIADVLEPGVGEAISPRVSRALDAWDRFLNSFPVDEELPSFPIWAMEFGADYPCSHSTPHSILEEDGPEALWGSKGSLGVSLNGLNADEIRTCLPSYALREETQFPDWKRRFIELNRGLYESHKPWLDEWLPNLRGLPASFQKLEWNAKGEKRTIWDYVIQLRASGIRVKRPTTAPSLIAMTDSQVPIIGWERRHMAPSECARLQALDSIELPESPGASFRALGNAVNSKVVQVIAEALIVPPHAQTQIPSGDASASQLAIAV